MRVDRITLKACPLFRSWPFGAKRIWIWLLRWMKYLSVTIPNNSVKSYFWWYCCHFGCSRWYHLLSLWVKFLSVNFLMIAEELYLSVVLRSVCYIVQGGSNFWDCVWHPKVWSFKESYWVVLPCQPSCGAVYYAVQNGPILSLWLKSY